MCLGEMFATVGLGFQVFGFYWATKRVFVSASKYAEEERINNPANYDPDRAIKIERKRQYPAIVFFAIGGIFEVLGIWFT